MTIRELRMTNKLTQAQFARIIGVSASTVGALENGKMKISDRIADRIWTEFGIEVGVERRGNRICVDLGLRERRENKHGLQTLRQYIHAPDRCGGGHYGLPHGDV